MSHIIKTKFGNASINSKGYYDIVSSKEGNFRKKLHRLIYEDHFKVSLMSWADIHHKDGNKLNNSIDNLELILHSEHSKMHHKGKSFKMHLKSKITHSKNTSSSNYFRVYKNKDKRTKQGFQWRYQYYDENNVRRSIQRNTIPELEQAVKDKGLIWLKLEEG